jgi:hypothetical protein
MVIYGGDVIYGAATFEGRNGGAHCAISIQAQPAQYACGYCALRWTATERGHLSAERHLCGRMPAMDDLAPNWMARDVPDRRRRGAWSSMESMTPKTGKPVRISTAWL